MSIEMVEFIYTDDVTVISKPQFEAHMNLYKGYIEKYNEIQEKLEENGDREKANAIYSNFRGLKRGETFALDGAILHELYFENIGGQDNEIHEESNERIFDAIDMYFGSYDQWKADFIATAKASRGWTILGYEQRSKSLKNISLDAHDVGNITLSFPLLVLDMYEHAYFLDYADKKGEYIDNFIKNINWYVVNSRLYKITNMTF